MGGLYKRVAFWGRYRYMGTLIEAAGDNVVHDAGDWMSHHVFVSAGHQGSQVLDRVGC
jgi:hypothetical protein